MSLSGKLEHLPIVDIVQLLHSSRKTGTLFLRSKKGESQLVFKDGYIVSANHHNNSVRIGRILVEMGVVTDDVISEVLQSQKGAGERKPLVAMLIERGCVSKEAAFKGLETLIELTIVEVLTWTEGTFALDVSTEVVSDEYRYFPENLNQDILLDTQSVLMDALRIYDEKNRDGIEDEVDWFNEDAFAPVDTPSLKESSHEDILSLEVLGLESLEELDRKIPDVFAGLPEQEAARFERQIIREVLPNLSRSDEEDLVTYLGSLGKQGRNTAPSLAHHDTGLILCSQDRLLTHAVTAAGHGDGFRILTVSVVDDLSRCLEEILNVSQFPVVVIDETREGGLGAQGAQLYKTAVPPAIPVIRFTPVRDPSAILNAVEAGARAALPKPESADTGYAGRFISFVEAFRSCIRQYRTSREGDPLSLLDEYIHQAGKAVKVPDVALALLNLSGRLFRRSLTLVVSGSELVSERSVGIAGISPATSFRLPLQTGKVSLFQKVVQDGTLCCGIYHDEMLDLLFRHIRAPLSRKVALVPLKSYGRVIALIYADYGDRPAYPVDTRVLTLAATYGTLMLENLAYRTRIEQRP